MKKLLKILLSGTLAFLTFHLTQAQSVYTAVNTKQNIENLKQEIFHKKTASYSSKDSVNSEQYKQAVALLTSIYPSSDKQKKGINILTGLLEKGNFEAGMFLANAYFKGIGVDKDEEKGINIIEKLAAKQHPEALYRIGNFYSEGGYEGYTENKPKAIEYYKKAAVKGYTAAYASVGQMAEESQQYLEAVQWYKKGMQGKDLNSMTRLANMYKLGKGLAQPNNDEAARIYHLILSSPDYEHSKYYSVYESFYTLGNKVISINASNFKPILDRLLAAAENNFNQIRGEEFQPIIWDKNLNTNNSKHIETYYRSTLDAGFKNAMINKTWAPSTSNGNAVTDSSYSYEGDIVFYATPDKSKDVFTKWVTMLKQLFPYEIGNLQGLNSNKPYFSMPVRTGNGKFLKIELKIVGQKSDRVLFKLLE